MSNEEKSAIWQKWLDDGGLDDVMQDQDQMEKEVEERNAVKAECFKWHVHKMIESFARN